MSTSSNTKVRASLAPMSLRLVAVLAGALAACAAPPAEDPSRFTMRAEVAVTSDPGKALAGAALLLSGQPVATTDESGRATVTLRGTEGDTVEVAVRCPSGHEPPPPLRVALRRLSAGSPASRFEARCAPIARTIVVGIRAENGPNLPVLHLGKVVGRTDASGVAHVVVQARSSEHLSFTLDTKSAERKPALRPDSPTLTVVVKDRDEFVVLEQKFEAEKVVARAPAPRPSGPQRL